MLRFRWWCGRRKGVGVPVSAEWVPTAATALCLHMIRVVDCDPRIRSVRQSPRAQSDGSECSCYKSFCLWCSAVGLHALVHRPQGTSRAVAVRSLVAEFVFHIVFHGAVRPRIPRIPAGMQGIRMEYTYLFSLFAAVFHWNRNLHVFHFKSPEFTIYRSATN